MKIAILSGGTKLYSTRAIIAAGEKLGHEVQVIRYLDCVLVLDPKQSQILVKGEPIAQFDAVIPRLVTGRADYCVLLVRQLEQMGFFCINSAYSIAAARNKIHASQLLAKKGVNFPATLSAAKSSDALLDRVESYPVVLKLLEGSQGNGVMLADSRIAAKSALQSFEALKAPVLAQKFINANGSDIRAFVVDGKVVAAMQRTGKSDDFRSNIHQGGSGIEIKLTRKERTAAIKAAAALKMNVAGVDLLRVKGCDPLVIEVNSSPGLEGIEAATGKDVAGSIIEYIDRVCQQRQNVKMMDALVSV